MLEITIATSIVPRNFELQRSAIDTWLNLGFKVISLNSIAEAIIVSEKFPDIPIKIASRTAKSTTGKPYVYFDDVCTALAESDSEICGIINSDIHLRADASFKDFIFKSAVGSFLFGSRIDVENAEEFAGERYFVGFDFFFFDKCVLACYPPSGFCLGAPWWDYWAPLVPVLTGIPCKEIVTPLAFHVWHETKWASELFYLFGANLTSGLNDMSATVDIDAELKAGIAHVLATKDFSLFSLVVLRHVLAGATRIGSLASDGRVEISLREFETTRRQLIERNRDCLQYASDNERLRSEIERLRPPGAYVGEAWPAIENSLSWRITSPLRWLGDKLRELF